MLRRPSIATMAIAAATLVFALPAFAATAATPATPATAAPEGGHSPHFGVQAGTLGFGITAGLDFSNRLPARAQLHRFEYSDDETEADYIGDLSLSSLALLADWHLGGSFRLTAGVVFNSNAFGIETSSADLELGLGRYDGDLRAQLDFDPLSPYAGFGWSTRRDKRGLGFTVDAGVLFQDPPDVTADGEVRAAGIGSCGFSIAEDSSTTLTGAACAGFSELRSDAMGEHSDLVEDLAKFELYPVAALGLVYRF